MSERDFLIRSATPDDAAALAAIYRPYVEGTAITFEYEAPSAEEFSSRIAHTLERYPYLVAADKADPFHLLGYAYASVYHGRAAYSWSVETSIYVAKSERTKGIGRALHAELEDELRSAASSLDDTDGVLVSESGTSLYLHREGGYHIALFAH